MESPEESPLIFPAKLDRLDLISRLIGPDVMVLECVAVEVTGGAQAGEIENKRLEGFLKSSRIVGFTEPACAAEAIAPP